MLSNLFTPHPASLTSEVCEELVRRPGLALHRIVSMGQATPAGEWFDQTQDEWVVLLSGAAGLRIEGELNSHHLKPGDYLMLKAHTRHRVEWTAQGVQSVWLALFCDPSAGIPQEI